MAVFSGVSGSGIEVAGLVQSLCPQMSWHDWSKSMHIKVHISNIHRQEK